MVDLAAVMHDNQLRDKSSGWRRVLGIKVLLPLDRCYRWMKQLTSAATWLEELGYAHCDIRPPNILLFEHDNVKLIDFDRASKIGDEEVLTEPFARQLLEDEMVGEDFWHYGQVGCRTEQFAIGSTLYSLTSEYEPYDDEDFGIENNIVIIDKLRAKEFPAIGDVKCDEIIKNCWNGQYASIKELFNVMLALDGKPWQTTFQRDAAWAEARRQECEDAVTYGHYATKL